MEGWYLDQYENRYKNHGARALKDRKKLYYRSFIFVASNQYLKFFQTSLSHTKVTSPKQFESKAMWSDERFYFLDTSPKH